MPIHKLLQQLFFSSVCQVQGRAAKMRWEVIGYLGDITSLNIVQLPHMIKRLELKVFRVQGQGILSPIRTKPSKVVRRQVGV